MHSFLNLHGFEKMGEQEDFFALSVLYSVEKNFFLEEGVKDTQIINIWLCLQQPVM